jgi:hypothetical protein
MVRTLADRMDSDELVACMLDQLICIDWTEEDKLWKTCLLAIELFSMSGKALEKTTREKEWMLIIPFLANQMNKALEKMPEMIREKGEQEQWNKVLVTLSNCFLDFADFLNLSASNKDVSEFPVS